MGASQSSAPASSASLNQAPPTSSTPAPLPSECPVKLPASAKKSSPLRKLCPHIGDDDRGSGDGGEGSSDPNSGQSSASSPSSQSVYNVYSQKIDPTNQMPVHANNLPSPSQSAPLSQQRVKSTIPKGGTDSGTWTYPSPQMFWNSINRKGKVGDTEEQDVEAVVAIHNAMNERTWKKVVQWERVISGKEDTAPKLLKFIGRPTDLSPKARLRTWLGYPLPFDRHDWTITRSDGSTARYVIDYYYDESKASDSAATLGTDPSNFNSILVDVRPAIDDPMDLMYRVIDMPLEVATGGTDFEYLPMMPTAGLKSQAPEARKTWESILKSKTMSDSGGDLPSKPTFTPDEINKIIKEKGLVQDSCSSMRKALDSCPTEMDCAKASLALTMCVAEVACPLQRNALAAALREDGAEEEGKVDVALKNLHECVGIWDEKVKKAEEQI